MDEQRTTEQQAPDDGDLVVKRVKIKCRVPLVGERYDVYAVAHAAACKRLRAMKKEEKARAKEAKERIEEADADAERLQNDIDEHATDGEVDGTQEWDYRLFEVRETRLDTAEVTTRPMSAEERTAWLDAHPEPEPPPKQPELPFGRSIGKVPGEDEPDEDAAPESSEKNGQRLVRRPRGRKAKAEATS